MTYKILHIKGDFMNSNAISKYFDELNNTKSTVKQETTHMKDLKKVETYQKGALKYEKLFNKLEKHIQIALLIVLVPLLTSLHSYLFM